MNIRQNSRILVSGALLWIALAACSPFDGELPPQGEFYYPTALKMHPSGDYLYVLSSNFDSEYRIDLGGTISVVDLASRTILPEFTLCLPSFGGQMLFSGTTFDSGDPRYLFASTRSNDGIVGLKIDENDPRRLTCPAKTAEITDTCVRDIEDLPDVSESRRELPCSVYNIVDDPLPLSLVPNDGQLLESLDAVAVAGARDSRLRVINFLNGEIRGESGQGNLDRNKHVSDIAGITRGPTNFAFHPVTHDMYVAPRFTTAMSVVRFLFRDELSLEDAKLPGFVATATNVGIVSIPNASTNPEVRSLVFSTDGTRMYAAQQNPSAIIVVDVTLDEDDEPLNAVIGRIPVPGAVSQLILQERAGRDFLYTALFDEREVAIIDLVQNDVIQRVKVGESPYAIELDEARSLLYVALFADHSVGVVDIDPASSDFGQLISTIR